MGRQRNVQAQVADRRAEIIETARSFADAPERFRWLEALLATHGVDPRAGMLVALRSIPDQGCWTHDGIWLTSSGSFLRFEADETYGERLFEGSGVLEHSQLDDITGETSTAAHVPGTGRSFGWLALDVLRALGKDSASR